MGQADVCLLVCDLADGGTKIETSLAWWRRKVLEHNPNVALVVVGCKMDLVVGGVSGSKVGVVSVEESLRNWAGKYGLEVHLTSAKNGGPDIPNLFQRDSSTLTTPTLLPLTP